MEQHFTAKTDVGARTILQGRKIARPRETFGAQTWARFVKTRSKVGINFGRVHGITARGVKKERTRGKEERARSRGWLFKVDVG